MTFGPTGQPGRPGRPWLGSRCSLLSEPFLREWGRYGTGQGEVSDEMVIRDGVHSRGLELVVEENEGMRQSIDKLLDAAGFSGITYSNAEDLIAGGRFDDAVCVISDIKLPGRSGFDLLSQLRMRLV